jgi:acyl-CoA thioesterase-1
MTAAHAALCLVLLAASVAGAGLHARADAVSEPAPGKSGVTLLAFGDSLTAGYNLPQDSGFPVLLEAALNKAGYKVRVINGGVSGDTAADGRARLDWVLADNPDFAIVELGANDFLRGFDPKRTYDDLDAILTRLHDKGVKVLLAGMMAPNNMGKDYVAEFDSIYPRLAATHKVALYPFFLDGVALDPKLVQADGLHPNIAGEQIIVQRILPFVERLLGPRAKVSP